MLSGPHLFFVIQLLLCITKFSESDIAPPYALCGIFEEYRSCGPKCPVTCDTLNTNVCCDVVCVSGCFCLDGYMLISNYGPRKCVPLNGCPKPGILEFNDLTVTVLESSKVVEIPVSRLNGSAGEISVEWRTRVGTAKERTDFVPSSGTLVFPDGVTSGIIKIEIIDDPVREPDEYFAVILSDPKNKAGISPRISEGARVIIKDDDMKPGYIEVEMTTITVVESIGTVNVNLVRLEGTDGQLRVQYRIIEGTALAKSDYVPVIGEVIFNEGEKKKIIPISIINDDVREPSESFQLLLFDPSAASDVINFRSRTTRQATTIIIMDDDMKPGYLELELEKVTIREDYGTMQVSVVRVDGTDGILRLKYRTVDVTAIAQSDYVPVRGDLVFLEGESKKNIPIVILNDAMKESIETFKLELFDLTAGSDVINFRALGTKLTAIITITDDDMTPGYIELSNTVIAVPESVGSISLNAVRKGGKDGEIRIRYKTVDGTATAPYDYIFRSGELVFKDGVTLVPITIQIINDDKTERMESFRLQLFEPSPAPDVLNFRSMSDKISTLITIMDDDMKPGYLELEQENITIREDYGTLQVNVVRVGGTDGILNLKYKTVDVTAIAQSDYLSVVGDLIFKDGESRKSISIVILNDKVKESVETFQLQLFDLTAGTGTINFRALGTRLTTLITIIDEDDNPGVFEFQTVRASVSESIRSVPLTIVRTDGSDGPVSLQLRSMSSTATEGVDYVRPPQTVIFPDGVKEKTVNIQIIDDEIKEADENFLVGIFNPTKGILGRNKLATVVIVDNDDPCIIRFRRRTGNFNLDAGFVEIPVIRESRLDRRVTVYWRTEDRSARAGESYIGTSSSFITFDTRESLKTLKIELLGNRQYATSDLFEVVLYNPSEGAVLGVPSRHTVQFLDYDTIVSARSSNRASPRPPPVIPSISTLPQVSFLQRNIRVSENAGIVRITVSRSGDISPLTVQIQSADGTATHGRDYIRVAGSLAFKRGDVSLTIAIRILDDDEYEPDKTFTIQLSQPSLGIIPMGMGVVTVTIVDDDGGIEGRSGATGTISPRPPPRSEVPGSKGNGLLSVSARSSIQASPLLPPVIPSISSLIQISFLQRNILVSENAGVVHITVSRSGDISPLIVQIRSADGTATQGRDYTRVTGSLSFKRGDVTLTIAISILDDDEYEPDETFTIQLSEPTLGIIPLGLGVVTVTIVDDDDGVEGRRRGSSAISTRPPSRPGVPGNRRHDLLTKCPDHLILKECADTCPPTCDSLSGKIPCRHTGCIRGCFCPEGLVKETGTSDRCVRPDQCPRGQPPRTTEQRSGLLGGLLRLLL